jgi:hypothetical protein
MAIQPYTINKVEYKPEIYLLFEWNVWKPTGKVFIEFATE